MNKLKMISLLTALSLLLVFFASCGTDDTSSSGGSKNDSQNADDSSSSTTDESQPPKEFSNATIVSQGKTYTASVAAGKGYEDTYNSELTDGILSASENADYTDKKFSGYAVDNSSLITFIIDLGKEYDNLYMFAVDYLCTNKVGIGPPSSISVHVSADNKKWDRLGLCKLPKSEEGTTKQAVLKLDKTVTGRYIKFAVSKSSAWTFLDELIVYADVPSESNDADLQNAISEIYKNDKNDYAAAIAALKSGNIDFSKPKIPVSITSHYEFSQTPLQKYNDSAKVKLTDNNICGYYESGSWVGFGDGKDVDITIELPQKRDDISQFTLDTYSNKTIGIYFPSCVMISVSSDNKTFTPVGRIFAPANSNLPTFTYSLVLDCAISAKYVRYTLKSFGKNIMLAEEATVYSYAENKEPETMYPQLEFPNITKPEFFPSSDKNFNDRINLIFNKTQQISVTTEPEKTYWDSNSPITSTLLTDGKFSTTNDLHNGSFFKFCRGSHRNVIYDLGKSCAIDTFTASFTNKTDWAVEAPVSLDIIVSDNAKDWYNAGRISFDPKDESIQKSKLTLKTPIQARFVIFSFNVNAWAGCDELEVFGTKKIGSNVKTLNVSGFDKASLYINEYKKPATDLLKGISDLCLMYHSKSFDYTSEQLLPYLAYLDKDGKIKDTMFDGFLFLLSGGFPSGAQGHLASTKADWEWQLNQIFAEGKNASALEETAKKVKSALSLGNDYKYKYYLTIYYPHPTATDFGDVDGDGKSENCSIMADRMKVIDWYVKTAQKTIEKADYKNIEFGGFYWFHEALEVDDDSFELLNGASSIVHKSGYDIFWIPYFRSNGYADWAKCGFDIACMQPNFVFNETSPLSNIKNNAFLTKLYGMGVEMEISTPCLTNNFFMQRYFEYLKGGTYYGYMKDSVHMYYQDLLVYQKAAMSKNPKTRLIYDYTYQFIKHTLDIYPDKLDAVSYETSIDTPKTDSLNPTKSENRLYKVTVSPKHGTVTIYADGTYTYYPDKGYTGADEFSYAYSNLLDYSENCTVSINVK